MGRNILRLTGALVAAWAVLCGSAGVRAADGPLYTVISGTREVVMTPTKPYVCPAVFYARWCVMVTKEGQLAGRGGYDYDATCTGFHLEASPTFEVRGTLAGNHVDVECPRSISVLYTQSTVPTIPNGPGMDIPVRPELYRFDADLVNGVYGPVSQVVPGPNGESNWNIRTLIQAQVAIEISPSVWEIMEKAKSWHIVMHEHEAPVCHQLPSGKPHCDESCYAFLGTHYKPLDLTDQEFKEAVNLWHAFCGFDKPGPAEQNVRCLHWVPSK